MPEIKGAGVVYVRKRLKDCDQDAKDKFYSRLTPLEIEAFHSILSLSWVPVQTVVNIYDAATEIFFPDEKNGLQLLGKHIAKDNFNTVYKLLLRVTTVPFLLRQSSKIWNTYHSKGKVEIVEQEGKVVDLYVVGYPELPEKTRQLLCGYYTGLLELTGAKDVVVTKDDSDPQAWRWNGTWR